MSFCRSLRVNLQVTAMMAVALTVPAVASAQEEESQGSDEFIGTVNIGESTRAIQTGTATATTIVDKEEINDRQASTIAELVDSRN